MDLDADHYRIIELLEAGMSKVVSKTVGERDIQEQFELFHYKFPSIGREELNKQLVQFQKFSKTNSYVSEHEAMRLLQKTAVELWALFPDIKQDKSHKIQFLEYLCVIYEKSFAELNQVTFNVRIQNALLEVRRSCLESRELETKLKEFNELYPPTEAPSAPIVSIDGLDAHIVSIAERISIFEHLGTSTDNIDMQRLNLEQMAMQAKRYEKECLTSASTIIDEEVGKIDMGQNKLISSQLAERALKEQQLQEKREREERKLAIKERWESNRDSKNYRDYKPRDSTATEEEAEDAVMSNRPTKTEEEVEL